MRNASIRQTGAEGDGSISGSHFQEAIRSITAGSFAMTPTGTAWFAPSPLTTVAGWWSPTLLLESFGRDAVWLVHHRTATMSVLRSTMMESSRWRRRG